MANLTRPQSPDQLFGELYRAVQLGQVFTDSKTFVDCVPKMVPAHLIALYESEKQKPGFDLSAFVHEHFVLPPKPGSDYVSDTSIPTAEHINRLWDWLARSADPQVEGSSRIPLPHPYIVPGGRFREIFYWDTYYTMLGLQEAGRMDLIRSMLDNFAYLIDLFGYVPNGNRTYFLSRSQPPYFALMVQLLAETDGPDVLSNYLPQLQREYDFWMQGRNALTDDRPIVRRVVQVPDQGILNRHWDDTPTIRPEAYRVEAELADEAQKLGIDLEALHTHVRAACESGWDFSSRWFSDGKTMTSIHAADIVPVDLNCALYFLEITLRDAYRQTSLIIDAEKMEQAAAARKEQIQTFFWNEHTRFFHDYDAVAGRLTPAITLAGVAPLFFKLASPEQASHIHNRLKTDFLKEGGWVTTLVNTGQQWDWPNGWAPLQWIVYKGLLNYGFTETAREGRDRWLALNDKVFKASGKMMEKYNVVDAALTTGGGKYPNQDGFGWTNGVYLRMVNDSENGLERV
ncbi:alpha,alpha-trehalase TreF [Spirosoma taeanense]|uniref:Alpha,alpha-trehalase TreF n=1 Tax=Spirosoma taeanense TaxID=2735870 RepID=A0A6M5YE57_9BACT|nr:alpha,alpha-trehalase TreF [Spirosoma taeanense]QJW91581.1 alpha,alpha-trehalase TreF [Spirosoma taeanense]